MRNLNRVVLTGNLVRDPELRHTQGGTAVCNFSIAVNGSEKVDGEWVERADFFDVTVWGAQGEACAQYLAKGSPAAVDGRLRQDRWQDKETQANRSKVIVVADNVQFLGGRDGDGGGSGFSETRASSAAADFGDDFGPSPDTDIPFAFLDRYEPDGLAAARPRT